MTSVFFKYPINIELSNISKLKRHRADGFSGFAWIYCIVPKKRQPTYIWFCSTSISPPKTNNFALTDEWLEDDIAMGRKISSSAPKKQSKLKLSSRTSTSKRQRLSIDDDFEVEEKDSTVALEDDSPPIPPVEEDIAFIPGMVTQSYHLLLCHRSLGTITSKVSPWLCPSFSPVEFSPPNQYRIAYTIIIIFANLKEKANRK